KNRQPRSTARTVDKRMQISPVRRIVHFLLTFLTDSNVRRHKNVSLDFAALDDRKIRKFRRFLTYFLFHVHPENHRPLRWTLPDILAEIPQAFLRALRPDLHVRAHIADTAPHPARRRMAAHRRAKSHAL